MATRNPECPICGDRFQDGRGLVGHLRFAHSLEGEELENAKNEGMARGQRDSKPARPEHGGKAGRSVRDRELEIKGLMFEIQERREELEEESSPFMWSSMSDEVRKQMGELDKREERCRKELEKIQDEREVGNVPDAPPPEDAEMPEATDESDLKSSVSKANPQDA